jgi:hypothetical protein
MTCSGIEPRPDCHTGKDIHIFEMYSFMRKDRLKPKLSTFLQILVILNNVRKENLIQRRSRLKLYRIIVKHHCYVVVKC